MVNKWLTALQRRALPGLCIFCRQPSGSALDLCQSCRDRLPRNDTPCARCGLPLASGPAPQCGRCLSHPPPITATIAPWRYSFPLDAVISQIKHRRRRDYLQTLAQVWLDDPAVRIEPRPDALVPVPLHWRRRWWRGFNQAEELALTMSRRYGIPLINGILRQRATAPQQGLTAADRQHNLRDAFALRRALPPDLHVAIVDDVVTTGATTRQLAAILARGGAARIDVWCLARTGSHAP